MFKALYIDKQQYSLYSNQMRGHMSEDATSYISSMLRKKQFDVVHVEGYYLMQHLPACLDVP
ncbi:MAG: hypothetical protein ACJ72C_05840, partial [Nitrososphaeraceae archaeon]